MKKIATQKFPFSVFSEPSEPFPIMWLQNPKHVMEGQVHFAEEEKRYYLNYQGEKNNFNPLCDAALAYMKNELGGYPDRHDPLPFRWVIRDPTNTSPTHGHVFHGSVFVAGKMWSGETEGVSIQFNMPNFPGMGFGRHGTKLIPPIRVSQKFNWTVLDDEGFEQLMFRLFFEMSSEYDDVQWLQKTRAADSGRDISAVRVENSNRVLIQARHQQSSITAPDVNDVVVKSETWNPKFDEVIVVTTSSFTQEAVRWVDNHNQNPGERPTVKLEPYGHIEVLLIKYPYLISHLGLRN